MSNLNTDFAALVGSRICHDLISPVGAIHNGLELISMSGDASGPEIDLISGSVNNATARIRFFRIAFGFASENQTVSELEIRSVLGDCFHDSRITCDWLVEGGIARTNLRAVFLAILCAEAALGRGGVLSITQQASGHWEIIAFSERLTLNEESWRALEDGPPPEGLTPNQVEFGLLPHAVRDLGRTLTLRHRHDKITLIF